MAVVPPNTMLHNFLSQLDVRADFLATRLGSEGVPADFADTKAAIQAIRSESTNGTSEAEDLIWSRAYEVERRLALLEPDDTLVAEIRRRLDEAVEEKVNSAPRLRSYFEATLPLVADTAQTPPGLKPGGATRLRAILLAVLEEIHWTLQRKFHARPIQKKASQLVAMVGIIGCLLFLLPYVIIYITPPPEPPGRFSFSNWTWLPLYTAATTGFFGAMFSRLLTLQTKRAEMTLGELNDARDLTSILLRGAVGTTGAVIVFFFLLSGVVGGALIPKFAEISFDQFSHPEPNPRQITPLQLVLPNAQLALLVVWTFLSGFSERLVPSVLKSSDATISERPKQAA
ncbi:hypothetical protein [Falsiroseomonas sp.]|uniref:hypothetical protein n=1 Tax=Falsiroseomonas sp. TaxID=2870721 RepID=UPI00271F28C1|nr:hypothetical protein [Falsiroseomonas sp.]MDO9498840.1 hypothetical protein [Falsiroseomonas sp.]